MKDQIQKKASNPSCFYFLGFGGALIYFISTASGFWMGALGFLKAAVWPVFLVYEAFQVMGI